MKRTVPKKVSHIKVTTEQDLLKFFTSLPQDPRIIMGVGDDAAVFDGDDTQWVITTDSMVEESHFKLSWITPKLLGQKAAVSNLSDIAAMGAWPRFALVSLILPSAWFAQKTITQLYAGITHEFKSFGTTIIGGNVTKGATLSITITILGDAKRPLYRDGAQVGDSIFLTGSTGDASYELHQLLTRKVMRMHHIQTPHISFAYTIAKERLATSAIDISDGLSLDLSRLCKQSSVGATIYNEAIPLSQTIKHVIKKEPKLYPQLVLQGGEMYELLFTANKADTDKIMTIAAQTHTPCTHIGTITRAKTLTIINAKGVKTPLPAVGWDHNKL